MSGALCWIYGEKMQKKSKVLVTGGSGFLGSHLIKKLLHEGREVHVVDIRDCPNKTVSYTKGDVRDRALMKRLVKDMTCVFHLASVVPQSKIAPEEYHDVIVNGTASVLEACLTHNIKMVHVSSSGVYGVNRDGIVKEHDAKKPMGYYGTAKWAAELKCQEYVTKGAQVVIVRPMAIIGERLYGVFLKFLDFVQKGYPLVTFGNGSNKIQLVSAGDCANGLLCAEKYKKSGEVFNLGSENIPTVREEFQALVTHARSGSPIIPIPIMLARGIFKTLHWLHLSPLTPEHYYMLDKNSILDITKAKKLLKWKPKDNNTLMMQEAYDWYVKEKQ